MAEEPDPSRRRQEDGERHAIFLWETKFKQVRAWITKKARAARIVTEESVFKAVP